MTRARKSTLDRREFLAAGLGAAAVPLVLPVPSVFAAHATPGMVVVKGGADLPANEAAYQRLKLGTERMGGLGPIVKGKHVLIKVNATERTSQDGNTSVPAAVALLRLVKESGASEITVLGQEWGGFDSPRAGQPTLRKVIKKAGASLLELHHYWKKNSRDHYKLVTPKDSVWHELWVAKAIFEPDTVLLNLARLKTHPHCVFTGCFKNIIGLTRCMYGFHKVDDVEKPKNAGNPADSDGWHVFTEKLAVAYGAVIGPKIALNILDAGKPTFGWRGPAPERIHTFDAHTTIVGRDALAMDVYGCGMLHAQRPDDYVAPLGDWGKGSSIYVAKNKTKINYLVKAGEFGAGETDLKKVDIDEAKLG